MNKDPAKPDWAMSRREKEAAQRVAKGSPPSKRRWWIWPVLIVVILGGAGGYLYQSGTLDQAMAERKAAVETAAAEAAAKAARPPLLQLAPFEVTTVAPMVLRDTLKMTGSLAPTRQLHLSSEVSGRILSVAARAGDAVSAGDILVQFDVEALENQLAQAMSNTEATRVQLDLARSEHERTQNLVDRGLSAPNALERTRSTLDQLTATLAAQSALVENAQRSLDRATVTAPFDGIISDRSVDPGQFAGTGSPLMSIVDLSKLEVQATAPVSYSPFIKPGQQVELTVEGFGARIFDGRVERLNPIAIAGSRMLPVYISLDNAKGELRGGMFAAGKIVLEQKTQGIGLPFGAIRTDADGTFVFAVEQGMTRRRAVETGREWDGGAVVEIASGVAAGDVIVIEPLAEIKPGMAVELVE